MSKKGKFAKIHSLKSLCGSGIELFSPDCSNQMLLLETVRGREKLKEVAVLQRLLRYCTAYMCMCFFGSARLWRGETSVLSLGRIICGSFAAFRPGMTSHLQDVASIADPVLSGCVSRQGPASPSGPAPRLTDDNTTTLCLRELWEKKK